MASYNITEHTITVVIFGEIYSMPRTAPAANAVIEGIRNDVSDYALRDLCNPTKAVEVYSQGRIVVTGDEVTLDGRPIEPCIERRIVSLMRDGLPFDHLLKFLERLEANPSQRAVTELYRFLEHEGMPITPEGNFLAYKGVQENRYSCTGNRNTRVLQGVVDSDGKIYNGDGCVIEVERKDVDDNCNRTCSSGLHAGSHSYASGFGAVELVVEIDPADVVSVPTDCNGQKVRVCEYKVLRPCRGLMGDTVARASNPYAKFIDDEPEEETFGIAFVVSDVTSAPAGTPCKYAAGYSDALDDAAVALDELR